MVANVNNITLAFIQSVSQNGMCQNGKLYFHFQKKIKVSNFNISEYTILYLLAHKKLFYIYFIHFFKILKIMLILCNLLSIYINV